MMKIRRQGDSKAVNAFLDRNDIHEPAKRKISYDNPTRLYTL